MVPTFDVLTTTASELKTHLENGILTSVQIVNAYVAQIEAHNKQGAQLRAIIATPPQVNLLKRAQELDDERKAGNLRGTFHGIPIVLKDCFTYEESIGLKTTVGSVVFERERGIRNAAVVQQLVDQGMIILGTANLSEFCGHKAEQMTPGWSAISGQTRSAYDPEPPGTVPENQFAAPCGGSSSGSGVSVSAGFSPLSIGTETGGSLVWPASKAGLYAMKPTLGSVSSAGAFRISRTYDGIGAMAKSAGDLAVLIDSILTPEAKAEGRSFTKAMTGSWESVKVGIVESTWGGADKMKWGSDNVKSRYESLVSTIQDGGGFVVFPAAAPQPDILNVDGKTGRDVAFFEFNSVIEEFCAAFQYPNVHNLSDIIDFNVENSEMAMPKPHTNQKDLIDSRNTPLSELEAQKLQGEIQSIAKEAMDGFMAEIGVDLIVSNSDCSLVGFTSAIGCPSATVPLGQLENGLPYGMFILARSGEEEKIFEFMSAFEKTMPGVKAPILKVWG